MSICKWLIVGLVIAACGGKKSPSEPPPPKPETGAPVALIGSNLKPGADHSGSVEVKVYNFSDKRIGQYDILLRYHDASGAVLKVNPGTPFEKDFGTLSFSGSNYVCAAASWCSYKLGNLDVPDKAVSVEILARRLKALKDDLHFASDPLFELNGFSWPTKK